MISDNNYDNYNDNDNDSDVIVIMIMIIMISIITVIVMLYFDKIKQKERIKNVEIMEQNRSFKYYFFLYWDQIELMDPSGKNNLFNRK